MVHNQNKYRYFNIKTLISKLYYQNVQFQVICEKTTAKEREAFDVREQRLDGTEAIKYKVVDLIL